jgi:hypothetical protein
MTHFSRRVAERQAGVAVGGRDELGDVDVHRFVRRDTEHAYGHIACR